MKRNQITNRKKKKNKTKQTPRRVNYVSITDSSYAVIHDDSENCAGPQRERRNQAEHVRRLELEEIGEKVFAEQVGLVATE
jgi:hypothetical protein